METLYSFPHERPGGALVMFDFVAGSGSAGWFRHGFSASGSYTSVARVHVDEIRDELGLRSRALFVLELRSAASALAAAVEGLRARASAAVAGGDLDGAAEMSARAEGVEIERLEVVASVMAICDEAWELPYRRLTGPAPDDDEEARGVARRAVRRILGPDRD